MTLFHSDTVTIVPQWNCYDCSTVTLLRLFHTGTVTIVPWRHCYDCSTMTLLSLLHSETVAAVPQWHCYDVPQWHCYDVPQWHCYERSTVRALRYKFYGLLTLVHSEVNCWRITRCTRNTTNDAILGLNWYVRKKFKYFCYILRLKLNVLDV